MNFLWRSKVIPACISFVNKRISPKCLSEISSRNYSQKGSNTHRIVMLRHGESEWNAKNLFCGWIDVGLTKKGVKEAHSAAKAIKDAKLKFDVAHTSILRRAKDTLKVILKETGQESIPVTANWRLNERHYGALTGLNKQETAKRFGEKQVQIWRRSFDVPPPPMKKDHKYFGCIADNPLYDDVDPCEFPNTESLKTTMERTLPHWKNVIVPQMLEGKRIIIVAHGNSLRGIIKHIDKVSNDDIMKLNLPTGIPFVYEFDECLNVLVSMQFLGDSETVKKAMEAVSNQGKTK